MKARQLLERLNELPDKELDRDVICDALDGVSVEISEVIILARFPGNLAKKDNKYLRLR